MIKIISGQNSAVLCQHLHLAQTSNYLHKLRQIGLESLDVISVLLLSSIGFHKLLHKANYFMH